MSDALDIAGLRSFTPARVGLRSAGKSLATSELLDLGLCLAEARDAVHAELSVSVLAQQLRQRGLESVAVQSAASDRSIYLRRPDLGRRLSVESSEALRAWKHQHVEEITLAICFADGLSSLAIERHAIAVLETLLPLIDKSWSISPVVIARQARVALGDEVGEILGAKLLLMLIGERPGLSSPDSLGAYITWKPRAGRTDAERNCVSNIRPEGLGYEHAARKLAMYFQEAQRLKLTGVSLKEDAPLLGSGSEFS